MNYEPKQAAFLDQVGTKSAFYSLFNYLPGVSFFAKNKNFEIIFASQSFVERLGFQSEADIIGKTDFDLFPNPSSSLFLSYKSAVVPNQWFA